MKSQATDPDWLGCLCDMLNDVQRYFTNDLENGIAALPGHPESWAFVGMDIHRALGQLEFARRALAPVPSPRFLDCGAGLGFIGMVARGLGFRPSGIELCPRYINIANRMFAAAAVVEGDVLTFDEYGDFDAIYYYGPMKDDRRQEEFELRVEAAARPGAVIIANRKVSDQWRTNGHFECLLEDGAGSWIFRKLDSL